MQRVLQLLAIFSLCVAAFAQQPSTWTSVGPYGGDARSLAVDPKNPEHIFVGSPTGEIFVSEDFGARWTHLAHIAGPASYDLVVDHIVISPATGTLYAAAWSLLNNTDGGVFRSEDNGKTWDVIPGMKNKSVRSLSMAPSDPKTLVAGALDGVFRTQDGGATWEHISPANYAEIRNVESIAIDPANPDTIYAGTWHLPWKTTDGGKTWHPIHNGVLDDSDVFSIIVDPKAPAVVYVSACSGIYKSDTAGELFHKAQGIPFTARRTRVLQQDPLNRQIVYAGTTEGLWRTPNGGSIWKRLTSPSMIINDVLVDPRNSQRVLLATDRSGVLMSSDGGVTFRPSNEGYTQRIVSSLTSSAKDPQTLYAGLIKDKEDGGVFVSRDLGGHWEQISRGLGERDVYVVRELPNGTLVAGTEDGIYMRDGAGTWKREGTIPGEREEKAPVRKTKSGKRIPGKTVTKTTLTPLSARVHALENAGNEWYAGTVAGLYRSDDELKTWKKVETANVTEVVGVVKSKGDLVIATRSGVLVSNDEGKTWRSAGLKNISSIVSLVATPTGTLWAAGREAAFYSTDHGTTWNYAYNLPLKRIAYLGWVPGRDRIVAAGVADTTLYQTTDGASWSPVPTQWLVRGLLNINGRLIASTAFDGVVVQSQP